MTVTPLPPPSRTGAGMTAPQRPSPQSPSPQSPSPKRAALTLTEKTAALFIAALALALRVVNLNAVGLNSDEAVYAGQGGALLEVGELADHFSIFRAHPLLLQFTMGTVFRAVGQDDLAARAVVAVGFGFGSVVASYFQAKELYGTRVALCSAAILAAMPYHVIVSRQVLVDTPMSFFAVVGIYLAVRFVRTDDGRFLYGSFFACALAAISKEIAVLFVPVLFLWMTVGSTVGPHGTGPHGTGPHGTGANRVAIRRFVGPSLIFAAITLPFPLTRLVNQPENASQFFLWQFTRSPNHAPDYFPKVLLQFAGFTFLLLFVLGAVGLLARRTKEDQLLLWWIGSFGIFFQFWPTKLFPYLYVILPAMAIASMAAAAELLKETEAPRLRIAFSGAVVALTLWLGFGSTQIVLAGPTAELAGFGDFDIEVQSFAGSREFGQWAGANTPENSRFITIGPSLGNILRFYGSRDSVALSVSSDPAKRNPAYVPIANPNLAMRQMSVHYVVWDAYSADRSAFYNNRLRDAARSLGGEIVFSAWAEGQELFTAPGAPPDGVDVRIVVWDVPGAGSTTGGQREAGLS